MNNLLENCILGHIQANDKHSYYTFIFDTESFEITLIPTTPIGMDTEDINLGKSFNDTDEWIAEKEFKGVTSNNKYILFRVEGVCDSVYGCMGYKVFWYCILNTKNRNDLNAINSVQIYQGKRKLFLDVKHFFEVFSFTTCF